MLLASPFRSEAVSKAPESARASKVLPVKRAMTRAIHTAMDPANAIDRMPRGPERGMYFREPICMGTFLVGCPGRKTHKIHRPKPMEG
jgi:hypothetical protein